jgi:hypothetical protein
MSGFVRYSTAPTADHSICWADAGLFRRTWACTCGEILLRSRFRSFGDRQRADESFSFHMSRVAMARFRELEAQAVIRFPMPSLINWSPPEGGQVKVKNTSSKRVELITPPVPDCVSEEPYQEASYVISREEGKVTGVQFYAQVQAVPQLQAVLRAALDALAQEEP